MPITCVLFDHDDTLLPTFELRVRSLAHAARELLGREMDAAAFLTRAHGQNLEQMSEDLTGGDDALAAKLITVYRDFYYEVNREELAPFPGIADTLARLSGSGLRLAVVTSKLRTGASEELGRTGLGAHFEIVVGAEDVREAKPAAEPLVRAMDAVGARPEETLMVGDTSADMLGARAAGTASAAALWGAQDRDGLLALGPDHALESPTDVLTLVTGGTGR